MFIAIFSRLRPLLGVLLVVSVSGCATYGPSDSWIGKTQTEVSAQLGAASLQRPTDTGNRLIYAKGPYGLHTYILDFDRDGRLVQWQQALTEATFAKIIPGLTADAVEDLIGPSFEKVRLGRSRGEVWSYRYETPFCIWFQVELDAAGAVRSAGHGIPPECARLDDWFNS